MNETATKLKYRRNKAEIWKGDSIVALVVAEDDAGADDLFRILNSHDALLEALREITTAFCGAVASAVDLPDFSPEEHVLVQIARAAIAKAEKAAQG